MRQKDKKEIGFMFGVLLHQQNAIWNKLCGKHEVADNGMQYLLDKYGKDLDGIADRVNKWVEGGYKDETEETDQDS